MTTYSQQLQNYNRYVRIEQLEKDAAMKDTYGFGGSYVYSPWNNIYNSSDPNAPDWTNQQASEFWFSLITPEGQQRLVKQQQTLGRQGISLEELQAFVVANPDVSQKAMRAVVQGAIAEACGEGKCGLLSAPGMKSIGQTTMKIVRENLDKMKNSNEPGFFGAFENVYNKLKYQVADKMVAKGWGSPIGLNCFFRDAVTKNDIGLDGKAISTNNDISLDTATSMTNNASQLTPTAIPQNFGETFKQYGLPALAVAAPAALLGGLGGGAKGAIGTLAGVGGLGLSYGLARQSGWEGWEPVEKGFDWVRGFWDKDNGVGDFKEKPTPTSESNT